MALHAQARQLARHGRIRTRRSRVAMSRSPHRRQANPRPPSHRKAGPPQQAPRPSPLANHNRQRPRQAEETVPSVRVTRATRLSLHCGEIAMISIRVVTRAGALALVVLFPLTSARAEDQLKVAIGQINNWENQAPTLGQDAGIFKRHNLVLENVGTQGAGETLQPVIAGSADLGAGVGVAGVMRAFARGAPVRILLPAFTGTGDLYWYVKADSPLKTIKDITANNTIAYSTSGSSSNNLVLAFVDELGVKAKPTPTGGPAATLNPGLARQIDICWGSPA